MLRLRLLCEGKDDWHVIKSLLKLPGYFKELTPTNGRLRFDDTEVELDHRAYDDVEGDRDTGVDTLLAPPVAAASACGQVGSGARAGAGIT